jgi:hypothetical protein
MPKINVKRGNQSTNVLDLAELAFATDTKKLFVGNGIGNSIVSGLLVDTYANIPAAGYSGRMFWATDQTKLYIDNGASWTSASESQQFLSDSQTPTGFVDRTKSLLSFNNTNRTFTITPNTNCYFWNSGVRFLHTTPQSKQITTATGNHLIYFDQSGNIQELTSAFDPRIHTFIAIVYWNNAVTKGIIFDERHGIAMDPSTHIHLHNSFGLQYWTGLDVSGYTLSTDSDAAVQIGVSNGIVGDEDIKCNITHAASPYNPFEQILTKPANIPVYYLTGSNVWVIDTETNFFVKNATAGRVYYNQNTGTWALTEATNGRLVAYWICATNSHLNPIISIMGQRQDSSLLQSQTNNTLASLLLYTFPSLEIRPLYRIIVETENGFSGTRKMKIQEVLDYRTASFKYLGAIG